MLLCLIKNKFDPSINIKMLNFNYKRAITSIPIIKLCYKESKNSTIYNKYDKSCQKIISIITPYKHKILLFIIGKIPPV